MNFKKILDVIKLSFNSDGLDFTTGNIRRAVVLLAIPMILELSLESVFALVDMFFVGKLGENAIATVGLTESVLTIVYSLAIGLSTAATAIVARRTGEKDQAAASMAAAQTINVAIVISLVMGIVGVIFANDVLRLMGASEAVIAQGSGFTRIMFAGCGSLSLLFVINGIFRGAGDAAMAMRSLWLASLLNIILCPILVHFMGVEGAAIATVIGRSSGVVYQLFGLRKGSANLQVHLNLFKPDWHLIKHIVALASPATFQFIIASGSWIILARLVAESGGTPASAGYQVAMRNVVFFILPAWGLSNAASTLVGQNLGAKQIERAVESVRLCARYNALFMAFVMVLFLVAAEPIINFFSNDPAVIAHGVLALRVIGTGYIFYGIGMVMTQALNGAGDTKTPTYINLIGFWCFQVPLAYLLAVNSGLGPLGAFIAIPVAETLIALMSWWVFKRGKWKSMQV